MVTNDDLRGIETMLRRRGDCALLSHEANEGRNELLPLRTLQVDYEAHAPIFCYLAPSEEPKRIIVRSLSDVKIDVDIERSEVIDFWRSYCDGNGIRRGRVFYTPRYFEAGAFFDKRPEFVSWAERTVAAIRRSLKFNRDLHAYVGSDAARKIASGELVVLSN